LSLSSGFNKKIRYTAKIPLNVNNIQDRKKMNIHCNSIKQQKQKQLQFLCAIGNASRDLNYSMNVYSFTLRDDALSISAHSTRQTFINATQRSSWYHRILFTTWRLEKIS